MKIICVLVLYNPSSTRLERVVDAIKDQVDFIWISDNSTKECDGEKIINKKCKEKAFFSKMNGNVGIAKAQNEGISYAIQNHYDFVFFLDQDSISTSGIVKGLYDSFVSIEKVGLKIGGIGPQPINSESGNFYKRETICKVKELDNIYEVRQLMNSASLFKVNLFKEVGMMDSWMFIDGVDHEICWRAAYLEKYKFFVNTSLPLYHKLGEGDIKFFYKKIKVSTPFRTYYQFRNYFYLLRKVYVPTKWKVKNGIKYICKFFYYSLFCRPRFEYFKCISRGIAHGIFKSNKGK